MKKMIAVIALAVAGCANTGANYRPIVDRPGANYEADLAQCQQHAHQVASAAESAAVGAVAGAVLGALLGIVGDNRGQRSAMAGVGALTGAVGAGAQGETDQRNIIRRCLQGRGYAVLQ